MSVKQTVTINGRHYDIQSGLAVDAPGAQITSTQKPDPLHRKKAHAAVVHNRTQRSQTLRRKAVSPPAQKPAAPVHEIVTRKQPATRTTTVTRHKNVSKFAPHPAPVQYARVMDIGPVPHPHVVKAHAMSKAKADAPLTTSRPMPRQTATEIKHSALQKAVANTSVNQAKPSKKRLLQRHPRASSIVSACMALVLFGGYLTYLNVPSLSVRVAAAQAGIDAGYPNYRPDGYSLAGTVGYSQGTVTMRFASNSGPVGFTINQSKSNWDSSAVLDKYVTPRSGASYIPYTERGLTIYTFGNNAAWVNGGILYTIDGDAPLSSEQIRRIATSLI
ncbi:MAG: hypothetical protein WAS27_02605 [Candidatus Saccharimonadales bacterium]